MTFGYYSSHFCVCDFSFICKSGENDLYFGSAKNDIRFV